MGFCPSARAAGEARTDGIRRATRGDCLERRDRSSRRQRMPQAGDQHGGTETDAVGGRRAHRQAHPHVELQCGRVVQPHSIEAERLGQLRQLHRFGRGRQGDRDRRPGHDASERSTARVRSASSGSPAKTAAFRSVTPTDASSPQPIARPSASLPTMARSLGPSTPSRSIIAL